VLLANANRSVVWFEKEETMKTFDDYQTETPKDGEAILRRILDKLLDADDCHYPSRGVGIAPNQMDNWDARNTIYSLILGMTEEPGEQKKGELYR